MVEQPRCLLQSARSCHSEKNQGVGLQSQPHPAKSNDVPARKPENYARAGSFFCQRWRKPRAGRASRANSTAGGAGTGGGGPSGVVTPGASRAISAAWPPLMVMVTPFTCVKSPVPVKLLRFTFVGEKVAVTLMVVVNERFPVAVMITKLIGVLEAKPLSAVER